MYMGVHFPSDVLGGALLGIGMMYGGFLFYAWYNRRVKTNDKY
jgi:membrane-associated phospholipid phosphatase